MDRTDYTPRRAQGPKRKHHRLRNTLIVLILLACAAFAVLRWGLPLWLDTVTPDDNTPTQSNVTADGPDTSGADSATASQSAQASTEPESQPEPAPEEPAASSQPEASAQTANTFNGEIDPLMLVNSTHALPEGYDIELTELSDGQSVATLIYPALQQMFDDARAQRIYPIVASGYRTPEKQQSLMDEKIQSLVEQGYSQESAQTEALKWVNQVGYSEHQSGLAVDINADGIHSAGYEVYDWLAQNA